MMLSEQMKLSHKFPQNINLAHLLFFDSLSSKCERRRGINLCHYSRARHDHARTHTHFHALTAYPKSMENNGKQLHVKLADITRVQQSFYAS